MTFHRAMRSRAILRERAAGHVLDRWLWLFPRVCAAPVMTLAAAIAPGPPLAAPSVQLPEVCHFPKEPEAVVVIVTRSSIRVGDDPAPVVRLPAREQLVASGVAAEDKRGGPDDLLIVPLAKALERERLANATSDDRPIEAIVVADASTPYRLLVEIVFTLGQSELGQYHLMVRKAR